MLTYQVVLSLVMLLLILLLRSVQSYYIENTIDNDVNEFDEDVPSDAVNGGVSWKSNDDYTYPENLKDVVLMKENPKLYFVTSVDRKRDNMARLTANKRMMTMMNNSIKDGAQVPGKSSLSIISPLEALQRKVAVVYNNRQRERNRGFLNDIGKRSQLMPNAYEVLEPEQDVSVLQSEIKQLKQVPHIQRRKFYGFYKVP